MLRKRLIAPMIVISPLVTSLANSQPAEDGDTLTPVEVSCPARLPPGEGDYFSITFQTKNGLTSKVTSMFRDGQAYKFAVERMQKPSNQFKLVETYTSDATGSERESFIKAVAKISSALAMCGDKELKESFLQKLQQNRLSLGK